jgi:hypothetical protein
MGFLNRDREGADLHKSRKRSNLHFYQGFGVDVAHALVRAAFTLVNALRRQTVYTRIGVEMSLDTARMSA